MIVTRTVTMIVTRTDKSAMVPLCGRRLIPVVLASLFATAACDPGTPGNVTWRSHAREVVISNCIQCHTSPPLDGAPSSFRLDRYETTVNEDGETVYGAGVMAQFMYLRVHPDFDRDSDQRMPPRFKIGSRQEGIIKNWFDPDFAPSRGDIPPPLGNPRAGNQSPTVTVLQQEALPDGTVAVQYEIRDPENDLVHGRLLAGQARTQIPGEILSGRNTVIVDAAALPVGQTPLFWEVNDGHSTLEIQAGDVNIVHANGNTAPTVTVVAPVANQIITDAQSPAQVSVQIVDPDANALTITVEAVRPGEVIPIASGPAVNGANNFAFNTTAITEDGNWRIRATVGDGTVQRMALGPRFIVGHRTTALRWTAGIRDIFLDHCGKCHPGTPIPELLYNFGSYAGAGPTSGVSDIPGLIYRRVVLERNMPPVSTEMLFPDDPPMPEEARAQLAEWFLAGFPE